jgi:hypothetical protein
MLRIDDTIFSLDILEKKFICDLPRCLGNCCRYGDAGAPISKDEALILQEIYPKVKPFLRKEGIKAIEAQGTSTVDIDADLVTPLIDNKECAYTIFRGGIYICAIEKAFNTGTIGFKKPLSCHLFPAKMKHFSNFRAINYIDLPICSAARKSGQAEGLFVYQFLKEPLTRAIGEDMYRELCIAAEELRKSGK